MRNIPWRRDELIVTLDFYFRHAPAIPGKTSQAVLALSAFLNELQNVMGGKRSDKFRNANSVYMKLMNFRRLDPDYTGKGLERGGKDESVVWDLYYSRRDELRRCSEAIRSFVSAEVVLPQLEINDYEGNEGQILTRVHLYRERNGKLVDRKKKMALKQLNRLVCEICDFDFELVYGGRGHGFIECHHTKPLSGLSPDGETTTMSDLSLVCSNCHRMIHRSKPWFSVQELRELVHAGTDQPSGS